MRVNFTFASTRGNTLRFSSAEEASQTVAKFQTSCWRSRGWWARMRARGTSTFTIRSEANEHSRSCTINCFKTQKDSISTQLLLYLHCCFPVDRGCQRSAERGAGHHDPRLLLLPQPVWDVQGGWNQRQQRLPRDHGSYCEKQKLFIFLSHTITGNVRTNDWMVK